MFDDPFLPGSSPVENAVAIMYHVFRGNAIGSGEIPGIRKAGHRFEAVFGRESSG